VWWADRIRRAGGRGGLTGFVGLVGGTVALVETHQLTSPYLTHSLVMSSCRISHSYVVPSQSLTRDLVVQSHIHA
jgi:hypothetical protein